MDKSATGAILKKKRESLGLSLTDVSGQTCINPLYLNAIEEGQYDRIRDPVYTRGFIRNYAQTLGLNGDQLVQQFNEETSAEEPVIPRGGYASYRKKPRLTNSAEVVSREKKRGRGRSFSRAEWMIIAFIGLSLLAFWIWFICL
jgi:cytoskeletal protein RodZ